LLPFLLASAAFAEDWWVPDEAHAADVEAALVACWPGAGGTVHVGVPATDDGYVWDGAALAWAAPTGPLRQACDSAEICVLLARSWARTLSPEDGGWVPPLPVPPEPPQVPVVVPVPVAVPVVPVVAPEPVPEPPPVRRFRVAPTSLVLSGGVGLRIATRDPGDGPYAVVRGDLGPVGIEAFGFVAPLHPWLAFPRGSRFLDNAGNLHVIADRAAVGGAIDAGPRWIAGKVDVSPRFALGVEYRDVEHWTYGFEGANCVGKGFLVGERYGAGFEVGWRAWVLRIAAYRRPTLATSIRFELPGRGPAIDVLETGIRFRR
jgi:hypothetical protein